MGEHTQIKRRRGAKLRVVLLIVAGLAGLIGVITFVPWNRVGINFIVGRGTVSPTTTSTPFRTNTPKPTNTPQPTATATSTATPTATDTPTATFTPTATVDPAIIELAKQSDYSGLTKIMEDPLVKRAIEEGRNYTIVSMYDEHGYPYYYGPFNSMRIDKVKKVVYAYGMADPTVVTEISCKGKMVIGQDLGEKTGQTFFYRDPLMAVTIKEGREMLRLFKYEEINIPISDEAVWDTFHNLNKSLQKVSDETQLILVAYEICTDFGASIWFPNIVPTPTLTQTPTAIPTATPTP